VLSLDYTFSGQTDFIFSKLLPAMAKDRHSRKRTLSVLMYGKVGGIRPPQQINTILIPNGAVYIEDNGRGLNYSQFATIDNVFADEKTTRENHFILHTLSVPLQRRSVLLSGQAYGCSMTDMEAMFAINAINSARLHLHRDLEIKVGYIGYISDTPLQKGPGTKLGEKIDTSLGQSRVVTSVIDYLN
jgi:hypothetical protein